MKHPHPHGFPPGVVLWSLGFRPFFLGAATVALLLMVGWLVVLAGGHTPSHYYGARLWHGHEMLFGYAVAVISGFLLTAIRNWAEVPTPTGKPLMGLFGLWLAGRLLGAVAETPGPLVAAVDLLFLPTLLIALAVPLGRAGKLATPHALVNLTTLALLFGANLLVHLERLGMTHATSVTGLNMGLMLIILLIGAVGGRVIPMFISRQFPIEPPAPSVVITRLTQLGLPALGLLVVAEVIGLPDLLMGLLAALAALGNGARLWCWYRPGVWRQPMLWVLITGFGWLVIGLTLKALAHWGTLPLSVATHALTVGAIGVLTLGMMARVSLGHSGQPMVPHRLVVSGFVLLNLTALVRVMGPLLTSNIFSGYDARRRAMAGNICSVFTGLRPHPDRLSGNRRLIRNRHDATQPATA